MFGSLYEIPDEELEDEEKTKRREEGQVSLLPLRQLTKCVGKSNCLQRFYN